MGKDDYEIEDDGRPTLIPTGDEHDAERPPPPDFDDTWVDREEEEPLFV